MRNITFIGNIETTFGSRWRRELDPESVERGKYLKRYFKKGQRIDDIGLVNSRLATAQMDAQAFKRGMNIEIDKKNNANSRSFNKKGTYTQNGLVAPKDRNYRRQSLANEREIRIDNAETLASKKRVAAMEEQFKNQPKRPKIDYDKPNVKFETKAPTPSNHVMPTNKVKLGMKGKLGLGAVGLATVGALGYGLLRKSRNDKGRKRGSYRK